MKYCCIIGMLNNKILVVIISKLNREKSIKYIFTPKV